MCVTALSTFPSMLCPSSEYFWSSIGTSNTWMDGWVDGEWMVGLMGDGGWVGGWWMDGSMARWLDG